MTEPLDIAGAEGGRVRNTVYSTEHQTRIRYKKGSLVVSTIEQNRRIPLEAVDAVVMFAGHITTDAIAECVRRKVRVSVLTRGGKIRFVVGGPVAGNVHLRAAHHAAASDETSAIGAARLIVAAKIRNSATVLRRWAHDHPDSQTSVQLRDRSDQVLRRVERVASGEDRDALRGIEGDTARIYFNGLAEALGTNGLRFSGRSRRPPRDPANAAMSFCYGLVTSETAGACDAIGLDPQVGFLHQALRAGRPSLALDLTEELRALTDRFVVSSIRRGQITPEHFTETPGGAFYLTDEGRRCLIGLWEDHKNIALHHGVLERPVQRWAIPTAQATLMARWLRGDLPGYPPFLLED